MKTEIREHNGRTFLLILFDMTDEIETGRLLGKNGDTVSGVIRQNDFVDFYLRFEIGANTPATIAEAARRDPVKGVPVVAEYGECRGCKADIIFARAKPTAKNPAPKKNPLNMTPTLDGNIAILESGEYEVLTGENLERAHSAKSLLYTSHWANCPEQEKFRKGKVK
jgi:hypothetical protein